MKKSLRYGLMLLVLSLALVVTGCSPDVGEDVIGTWVGTLDHGTLYITVQAPREHVPFWIGHLNGYPATAMYTDGTTQTNWIIELDSASATALGNKVYSKAKAVPTGDACILFSLFNAHAFGIEAVGSETLPYLSAIGEYDATNGDLVLDVEIGTLESVDGVTFEPGTLPL